VILRPGRLTNDPGTGLVTLAPPPVPRGSVTRDDIAAVVVALLDTTCADHLILEPVNSDVPVSDAVRRLTRS
jgi:hypothetical protein